MGPVRSEPCSKADPDPILCDPSTCPNRELSASSEMSVHHTRSFQGGEPALWRRNPSTLDRNASQTKAPTVDPQRATRAGWFWFSFFSFPSSPLFLSTSAAFHCTSVQTLHPFKNCSACRSAEGRPLEEASAATTRESDGETRDVDAGTPTAGLTVSQRANVNSESVSMATELVNSSWSGAGVSLQRVCRLL